MSPESTHVKSSLEPWSVLVACECVGILMSDIHVPFTTCDLSVLYSFGVSFGAPCMDYLILVACFAKYLSLKRH